MPTPAETPHDPASRSTIDDARDTSASDPVPSGRDAAALPWWARDSDQPYLTPKQVRLRTKRGVAGTLVFTLVLLAGIWWVLTASEVKDVTDNGNGSLAYKQTTNALIGGCGAEYTFTDVLGESGTVPEKDQMGISNRLQYRTIVPMFGPFWERSVPAKQRFWQRDDVKIPKPENLLANMWEGSMVVYYTAAVSQEDLDTLADVLAMNPELDIFVIPWDLPVRGPLPQNREIAFATWNASQSCHQLVAPALYDFRKLHPASDAPGYDGTKPPVLDDTPPINVNQ